MPSAWTPCRYDDHERGTVRWSRLDIDLDIHTCYHHAREHGPALTACGWVRVDDAEWAHCGCVTHQQKVTP